MENNSHNPEEIKYLLLNANEPIILKGTLDWELLKWNLEDWESLLKNEKLNFRCGKNSFTKEPQWERCTNIIQTTFKSFLSSATRESKEWMYFDYKYLKEWFNNVKELKENIHWGFFGFPEIKFDDCTIWIGSKGAHTPCHIDTYGCNLITQIYGNKQWILFPPEEDLKPSRIPYEESSIYSKLNFFSPTLEDFKGIRNCRRVVLEPGDVLFVPHKWWHYVENLNTAISINVWLPLPEDDEERLQESLVQLLISQITQNINDEFKNVVLNPNSDEDIGKVTLNDSMNLINRCKNICQSTKILDAQSSNTTEIFNFSIPEILNKYSFLKKIPKLATEEFDNFLQGQKNRFYTQEEVPKQNESGEIVNLLNAFTHPDVISLIKNKILE